MTIRLLTLATTIALTISAMTRNASAATFGDDAAFLKTHIDLIVLHDAAGRAQVAVAPAWQEHINVFGGEDRMWLGPEGGQFSIFFAKGVKFDLEHWFTPKAIDTMAWPVASQSSDRVKVAADFTVANFSGTRFDVKAEREVRLLSPATVWMKLNVSPAPGVELVGYESDNKITNTGKQSWRKETGLLSIWMLGMLNPSP